MKRMHIHIAVADLAQSIGFYSQLFNAEPTVSKTDYAKWMLEDPRINFAISARGAKPGLDHLGIQVDADEELEALRTQFDSAGISSVSEQGEACCYARSDKHWVTDPQGIAWEHFRTLGTVPTFNEAPAEGSSACCAPASPRQAPTGKPLGIAVKSSCC